MTQLKEKPEQILEDFSVALRVAGTSDYESTYAEFSGQVIRENYDLMLQILEKRGKVQREGEQITWASNCQ